MADQVVWRGLTFERDVTATCPRFLCGRWAVWKPRDVWIAGWRTRDGAVDVCVANQLDAPEFALGSLHAELLLRLPLDRAQQALLERTARECLEDCDTLDRDLNALVT